jgi:cholinesterase
VKVIFLHKIQFGQSAGGDSVDIYSYAWLKDPIVKGLIAQSGASTMCGLITDASRNNWPKVVTALNCSGTNELFCMRAKSQKQIMDAVKKIELGFPPVFTPMPDGKVVFNDYETRAKEGKFIKVVSSYSISIKNRPKLILAFSDRIK